MVGALKPTRNALKFFLPSGLYFTMLMGCADFFLDVLQLFTWMNAFHFKISGCMACIMSLSLEPRVEFVNAKGSKRGCWESFWICDQHIYV